MIQNACNQRYKDAYTSCYICHAKCKKSNTVIVNNTRANVLVHSLDRTVWSGKVEAILESEKYETLTVDVLFSNIKLSEVDRGVRPKIENLTDPHSLALVSGSRTNANMSSRQISLSCLVSMPDEEFDVLAKEDSRC
jgi:hypothetical protein